MRAARLAPFLLLLALAAPASAQRLAAGVSPLPLPVYGEVYEDAGATAINVVVAGTFYQWTTVTVGLCTNMTCSAATDNITATIPGTYLVTMHASFTATANATILWRLFQAGAGVVKCDFNRKVSGAGDVGAGAVSCIVAATAGQAFDLRVTSDGAGDTVTPVHANLNLVWIGP